MSDPVGTTYTVSDGDLVLELEVAEEGGYVVTSPLVPGLATQAETLQACFEMARDARAALRDAWAEEAKRVPA